MSENTSEKKKKFTDIVNKNKIFDLSEEDNKAEVLNKEFNTLKERAAQLENHLCRAVADTENIKRIMQKQISDASDYAITKFANDMIDSCDNLKKAIENARDGDPVHEGLRIVHQKMRNDLKKYGIEEMNPLGELFDSNIHQSIIEREDNEKEAKTIVEVLQTGYTIKKRLLRHAIVIISKRSDEKETDTNGIAEE